jgi:hypothetical protein
MSDPDRAHRHETECGPRRVSHLAATDDETPASLGPDPLPGRYAPGPVERQPQLRLVSGCSS